MEAGQYQVNELLHGASMIQLYHQEPGVVEEFEATTQKMLEPMIESS